MEEIIKALRVRLSNPVFGYFALALVACNWDGLFYLFFQSGDASARIEYFEAHSNPTTLLIKPVGFALVFSLIYPWLVFVISRLTAKPVELKDILQATSEHKLLLKKKELEDARSGILASAERELIERAKRDQELETLTDEDLRNRLKSEIDQLRTERDALRKSESPSDSFHPRYKELMEVAGQYRTRSGDPSISISEREAFLRRARELEELGYQMLRSQLSSREPKD